MSLAERAKKLRKEMGYSQAELATRVGNMPYQSIQNVELGRVVSPRFIIQLAEELETSVDYLLNGNEKPVVRFESPTHIVTLNKEIAHDPNLKYCVVAVQKDLKLFLTDGAVEVAEVSAIFASNKI
jgi:transcriptional regulator with XRE-family HTH domain